MWSSNIWRATACTAAWLVAYTTTAERSMTILNMLKLLSDSLVCNHYFTLKFLFTNAMVDVNFGLFWDYPCLRVAAIDIEIKIANFVFITSFYETKLARFQKERNDKLIHNNLLISTVELRCLIEKLSLLSRILLYFTKLHYVIKFLPILVKCSSLEPLLNYLILTLFTFLNQLDQILDWNI